MEHGAMTVKVHGFPPDEKAALEQLGPLAGFDPVNMETAVECNAEAMGLIKKDVPVIVYVPQFEEFSEYGKLVYRRSYPYSIQGTSWIIPCPGVALDPAGVEQK